MHIYIQVKVNRWPITRSLCFIFTIYGDYACRREGNNKSRLKFKHYETFINVIVVTYLSSQKFVKRKFELLFNYVK